MDAVVRIALLTVTFCFWCIVVEPKSLVKPAKSQQIDCKSRTISLFQLKAFASSKVACKGNNDEKFWRLACACVAGEAPSCPKCRISRDLLKNGVSGTFTKTVESSEVTSKNPVPTTPSHDLTKRLIGTDTGGPGRAETAYDRNRIDIEATTDTDYFISKLKTAQNVTTVSNSANFIRFGK